VRPLADQPGGARYEVTCRSSTRLGAGANRTMRAKNVIFAAGVMGTLRLLLRLRDLDRSLPNLSPLLGSQIRTNNEALLGAVARTGAVDFSQGIAITSIFNLDPTTRVEPVRYPDGSSLMRLLSAPLVDLNCAIPRRIWDSLTWIARHPLDFARALLLPGWAHNTTILLVMENSDSRMRFRTGRSLLTLGRLGLVADNVPGYEITPQVPGSHALAREFAGAIGGVAMGSLGENLLNLPTTAHILGGAPVGCDPSQGWWMRNLRSSITPACLSSTVRLCPLTPA
jgi:cholesterol oxidase